MDFVIHAHKSTVKPDYCRGVAMDEYNASHF